MQRKSYLHNIYIALDIINGSEMIYGVDEEECRFCANLTSFFM